LVGSFDRHIATLLDKPREGGFVRTAFFLGTVFLAVNSSSTIFAYGSDATSPFAVPAVFERDLGQGRRVWVTLTAKSGDARCEGTGLTQGRQPEHRFAVYWADSHGNKQVAHLDVVERAGEADRASTIHFLDAMLYRDQLFIVMKMMRSSMAVMIKPSEMELPLLDWSTFNLVFDNKDVFVTHVLSGIIREGVDGGTVVVQLVDGIEAHRGRLRTFVLRWRNGVPQFIEETTFGRPLR
jgi:hypothetical protein